MSLQRLIRATVALCVVGVITPLVTTTEIVLSPKLFAVYPFHL
jgi:hypothetical protein